MHITRSAKLLGASAVVLAFAATAAKADVIVYADIYKEKLVDVLVTVDKNKFVEIDVNFDEDLASAAEAFSITNQVNERNFVGPESDFDGNIETDADVDFGINVNAEILNSITDNTGIMGVNQDVGNMVNQANTVSTAAIRQTGAAEPAFTHAEGSVEQRNTGNETLLRSTIVVDSDLNVTSPPDKTVAITGSVNENSGIVGVNQNAGNNSNQANNVALSVGIGAALALSESDLGQENSGNVVVDVQTFKQATLVNSVIGNSGIVSGNQNTGNMNNQANSVAFSALTSTAAISVPGS